MGFSFKKFFQGIKIVPKNGSTASAQGDLEVDSATSKLNFHNGTTASPVVTEAHAQDITGKTLLEVDNLQLNGNTIASTNTDGSVTIDPNGNGNIVLTAGGTGVVQVGSSSVQVNASGNVDVTGDLDVDNININGNTIISTNTDGDITLTPNGTGLLKTDNLSLGGNTISSTDTNGDINLSPNGTGTVVINTDLDVDNINVNANTISSTNSNGDITLDPNGTGLVKVESALRIPEVSTPSTPASGYGNVYFKTDGYLYQQNDNGTETRVGAGESGINYILNGTFESDADAASPSGWSTYNDAAAAPVDGTGGTVTTTWLAESDSALRGNRSVNLVKDAANRQGEGASYDFTIASVDQGQVLEIGFEYTVVSGTYADGDVTVYIIQDPSGTPVVIQPVSYTIPSVTAGLGVKWRGTFQTATNVTSYRLCIHIASTSASAYTLKFDSFYVSPQLKSYGPVITDWVAWTPTGSWSTNTTYTGFYRQVGDSYEFTGKVSTAGAPTSAALTINLPSGMAIDTAKLSDANNRNNVGTLNVDDSGTAYYPGRVHYSSASTVSLKYITNASAIENVTQAAPITFGSGDAIDFHFKVPIVGKSSGQLLSSEAGDSREVSARYTWSGTQSLAGSNAYTTLNPTNKVKDTHAFNSSGTYTVPVSGLYRISATVYLGAGETFAATGNTLNMYAKVNGSTRTIMGIFQPTAAAVAQYQTFQGQAELQLNAGDTILAEIQNTDGAASHTASVGGGVTIYRISAGNQQIAASVSVNARFSTNTAASISTGSVTIIDFEDKSYDSHLATTTGASWKFTAPISGVYSVKSFLVASGGSWSAGELFALYLYKGGSYVSTLGTTVAQATASITLTVGGSDDIRLLAGEYIDIRAEQNSGGSITLDGLAGNNHVSITRTGNY